MEPRELWERHTVLARSFCHSDEEVKTAQTTLDDAQAGRARSLAAFAVVVGNDKAVAEMLGLPEREVRIARRTVGRDDARLLADDLLLAPQAVRQPSSAHPTQSAPPSQAPSQHTSQHGVHLMAQEEPEASALPHPQPQPQPQQQEHTPQSYEHPQTHDHMGWTTVQDAVLADGWQSGVDMELLAIELGTDLAHLTARAQYLSAQGRLFGTAPDDGAAARHGGKHRRDGTASQHAHITGIAGQYAQPAGEMLLPDGLVPDGHGGYWANWNEMLPAPQG